MQPSQVTSQHGHSHEFEASGPQPHGHCSEASASKPAWLHKISERRPSFGRTLERCVNGWALAGRDERTWVKPSMHHRN